MARYRLFVMDGCGQCEETARSLEGRDVEIINVDHEWERAEPVLQRLKDQGVAFDTFPKCVVEETDSGKMALCDTPHMHEFVPPKPAPREG